MENANNKNKESIESVELPEVASPMDFISKAIGGKPPSKTAEEVAAEQAEAQKAAKAAEAQKAAETAKEGKTPEELEAERLAAEDSKIADGNKPEEGGEPSVKATIKGNPAIVLAKFNIQQGRLPEDFEVTENISLEDVEMAAMKFKDSQYVEVAKNQLAEEERAQGITEDVKKVAKRLVSGITEEEVTELSVYRALSGVQIDPSSEQFKEAATEFLGYYYSMKSLPQYKIEQNIASDLADTENIGKILEDAREDFATKADSIEADQDATVLREEQAREDRKADYLKGVKKMINSLEVDGFKYTKQQAEIVTKALFEKTEIYEDADGNRFRVTPYRKKVLEIQKSPEKVLRQKIDLILGLDRKTIDNTNTRRAVKSIMNGLNDMIEVEEIPNNKNLENHVQKGSSDGIVRTELTGT